MHNFIPGVLNAGSAQEVLERVEAIALSSTWICFDMFPNKPIPVCILLIIEKNTSSLLLMLLVMTEFSC